MRLRMLMNVAAAALVGVGLVSIAPPASGAPTTGAPGACPRSPESATVKLIVASESVVPGQTVHFRVNNSAGPAIVYGTPYAIQECLGGVWVLASIDPPGPWTKQLLRQNPGHGSWWDAPIPTTAAAGEYRIRKSVRFGERGHSLYGDFAVVLPGV